MSIQRIAIANGLRDMLNAQAGNSALFVAAFTAQAQYVPAASVEQLAKVTQPLLTCAPLGTEKRKLFNRGSSRKDFVVVIGVQKKLAATSDPKSSAGCAELDELMQLTDQAADFVEPDGNSKGLITSVAGVKWVETEISSYDVDHLIQDRVFTSFVSITYAYL